LFVTLLLEYLHQRSTAPEQPVVRLKSIHARVNNYVYYRVPTTSLFGSSELQRHSDQKTDLARKFFSPARVVFDAMSLNDLAPLQLQTGLGPTFATFSVNRSYMLKISGIFECAGKDYDLTLCRHALLVHPPRALFRPIPVTMMDSAVAVNPAQTSRPLGPGQVIREETLPLYVASAADDSSDLPAYEERSSKQS
jgi:hypothetical protein